MPKESRPPMRVDPIFKDMVKAATIAAQAIENQRISEREMTRRLGSSEKIKLMVLEDSKLRAAKRKNG